MTLIIESAKRIAKVVAALQYDAHDFCMTRLCLQLFSRIQSLSLEPSSVNPANMVVKIEVTDVEVNVFKTLLRFFYHRKMEALSTGLATIEFCLLLLRFVEWLIVGPVDVLSIPINADADGICIAVQCC